MKTTQSKLAEVISRIEKSGAFFGAVYQKKDGEITNINARFGVKKHLRGGKRTVPMTMYVVWDSNRKRYAALEPSRIKSVTFSGLTYEI